MKLLVVSNMYPSKKYPAAGVFVAKFCRMLDSVGILHSKSVMAWTPNAFLKYSRYICFYFCTFVKCIFLRYDLIYVHYASHSSAPVLLANKFKKLRIITNVHGSDVIPENARQEKFQKYTRESICYSEKVVVPSEYFKNVVCEKYGIIPEKVYVFPSSGVDETIFHLYGEESLYETKNSIRINNNAKTFTYAGRITVGKGWDTFVKAINELHNKGFCANYIIVGSGNKEIELEKLINEYHLENVILRFPLMDQKMLAKIYALSDAFIFPTEREGESLGLVALEAMACGTPVIASDFAAPKHYIQNGINGFKFDKGDFHQLSSIILNFINEEISINDLKRGSLEEANKYLSNNLAKDLRKLFETL